MTFIIQGYKFVDPFTANTVKEGAIKALKILGFSYGAKGMIKRLGPVKALKELGFCMVEK